MTDAAAASPDWETGRQPSEKGTEEGGTALVCRHNEWDVVQTGQTKDRITFTESVLIQWQVSPQFLKEKRLEMNGWEKS